MFSKKTDLKIVEEARLHRMRWQAAQKAHAEAGGAPGYGMVASIVGLPEKEWTTLWLAPQLASALVLGEIGLGLVLSTITGGAYGLEQCLKIAGWTVLLTPCVMLWVLGLRLKDLFPFSLIFRL